MRRIERFFLWSVIAILLITAMAKMVTVWGVVSTPTEPGAVKTMLEDREPFFNLVPFRHLLLLAAWLEVSVVLILFSKASSLVKWNAVTYLCVLFFCFRVGLWMVGYHKSCQCMGSVLSAFNIPDASADIFMKYVLFYLFGVSYSFLGIELFSRKEREKPLSSSQSG